MKNKIFLFAASVFAAAISGCVSDSFDAEFPICAIFPLTGDCGAAAKDVIDGMELAVSQINAAGGVDGIPLKLETFDTAQKDFSTLETFDLMRRRGAKVFCVGFGKEMIFPSRLLSQGEDAFVNYMFTYPPATIDSENCTRIFLNGAQEGDALAKIVKRDPENDVQLVTMSVDNPAGKSDSDYLNFNLKLEKTKLYRDYFSENEKRFDVFSTQILRLYAQYVFYVGTGAELPDFVSSLSNSGYKGVVAANCGLVRKDFGVPKNLKLYRVETLFEQGKIDTEISRNFRAAFRAKYGRDATWLAAYGYDSIRLLADAVKKARFNPAKMRDSFRNTQYDGAIGHISFDNTADSYSEISVVKK